MANTKTKTVSKRSAEIAAEVVENVVENVENVKVEAPVVEAPIAQAVVKAHVELPADLYVPCVSMVRSGKLIYVSKRQIGYTVVWQNFADVQYIELKELIAMRASEAAFFEKNWIAIEDGFEFKNEVMKKLRIEHLYKNVSDPSDFDRLFVLPIEEMVKRVENMSGSLKESVHSYAKDCIASGSLDSLKRIRQLEKALGRTLS